MLGGRKKDGIVRLQQNQNAQPCICLDIRAAHQLTTDGRGNRREQLTHSHDPSIQRGAADLETGLPLQHRALPVQRQVSRAEESHPRALPEPYVNLSAHTATSIQPLSMQKLPVSKEVR